MESNQTALEIDCDVCGDVDGTPLPKESKLYKPFLEVLFGSIRSLCKFP